MASKEDINILGMVVSETLFRMYGFGPSRQICDEFAMKVLAEASVVGQPINLGVSSR